MMRFGLILLGTINDILSMKNIYHNQKNNGYTIIEMLLYIAIFSLIIGSILSVAMSIANQRILNQVTQEVDYQGNLAITNITQNLRNASTINTPTPSNSSASLSYNTATLANNPTIYDVVNDQSVNKLRFTAGSSSSVYLTSSRVTMSNLNFSNRAITGGRDSIYISFTLTYHNPANKPQLDYQKNFYGVTTLR